MRRPKTFRFITDTAALAVFDVASLRHRIQDAPDWWTIPWVAAQEINKGHCAIFDLESDGAYEGVIEMLDEAPTGEGATVAIHVPSGHVFLGAGEEITAGGLGPERIRGGLFLDLVPGEYLLRASRSPANYIQVTIGRLKDFVENRYEGYVPTS